MRNIANLEIEKNAIKIRKLQANNIFQVNHGRKHVKKDNTEEDSSLKWRSATMHDSIFIRYMCENGVTVNKKGETLDFINVQFDYAVLKEREPDAPVDEKREIELHTGELRDDFYRDGCTITWYTYDARTGERIKASGKEYHYKMLMRSPGKAKEGNCIFIREDLWKKAMDFLTMGLYDEMPNENADIVGMSAYSTLITASTIGYIKIPLENILIVKDQESEVYRSVRQVVTEETENEKKQCRVDEQEHYPIKNILWDGMGLIDDSIFPEEQGMEGFIYCRNHFFKSCLFRGQIQEWFRDYYGEDYETATVQDMFGREMRVADIQVIVTDNSIKWLKFQNFMGDTELEAYQKYQQFMKKYGQEFAIVKTAHKSKWGDLQRSSYQMNNSLPCTDRDTLQRIAQTSIDYYNRLVTDHDAYMQYLRITTTSYSINNVLLALDTWNCDFRDTDFFKRFKSKNLTELKNNRLKLGKLLQSGDNLTICGNPIALLLYVVGEDPTMEGCFGTQQNGIECFTTRFEDGVCLAGFRNPHNSPNNIVHLLNRYPELILKYFPKLGDNVIIINGIETDVQARLNGQDLDSDTVYVTDQADIVSLAERAYTDFPTIVNGIPLLGRSVYTKEPGSYSNMDKQISAAQTDVGYSSNLAQLALSYYYDLEAKADANGRQEKMQELYDIFTICSVLAQVAIDSGKREYDIKTNIELGRLQKRCNEIMGFERIEIIEDKDKKAEGKDTNEDKDKMTKKEENGNGKDKNSPKPIKIYLNKYPRFYAEIQKEKRTKVVIHEEEIAKGEDVRYQCPMEILYDLIHEGVIDTRKQKQYQTSSKALFYVFRSQSDSRKRNSKQYHKILGEVQNYDQEVKELDENDKNYSQSVEQKFDTCMKRIKKLKINQSTMSALIEAALTANATKGKGISASLLRSRLLTILYEYDHELFLSCFISKPYESKMSARPA